MKKKRTGLAIAALLLMTVCCACSVYAGKDITDQEESIGAGLALSTAEAYTEGEGSSCRVTPEQGEEKNVRFRLEEGEALSLEVSELTGNVSLSIYDSQQVSVLDAGSITESDYEKPTILLEAAQKETYTVRATSEKPGGILIFTIVK